MGIWIWLGKHGLRWRRRETDAQRVGRRGEEIAARMLREQGFTIVARNYRALWDSGELDLVARDQAMLVFVEVKSRRREGKYPARFAVNAAKRRNLMRTAKLYRRRKGERGAYRFDIVVVYDPEGANPRIEHHRHAFADTPRGKRMGYWQR